ATVTVIVTGENDAPTTTAVAITADDGAQTIGVFHGDDVDSDNDQTNLNYTITKQPAQGTVTPNGDGTFSFDPGTDFQDLKEGETRTVTFSYQAIDAQGAASNVSTGKITVIGGNDAPVVDGQNVAGCGEDVSNTDTYDVRDPEGDAVTFSITAN